MHAVLARGKDNFVEDRKVEVVFLRLDHFPSDTTKQSIDVCVHHFLPDRLHVLDRGQGRVLKLAGSHEKWTSLDDQLLGVLILAQMRDVDVGLFHFGDSLSGHIEECHFTGVIEQSVCNSGRVKMKGYCAEQELRTVRIRRRGMRAPTSPSCVVELGHHDWLIPRTWPLGNQPSPLRRSGTASF